MTVDNQRTEKANEKKQYALKLWQDNPGASLALIGGMVKQKFGSGMSNRDLMDLRGAASTVAKLTPVTEQPLQVVGQVAEKQVVQVDDEKLEAELVSSLQALMQRQHYLTIVIPSEGKAHIRALVEVEKEPGQHVEASLH